METESDVDLIEEVEVTYNEIEEAMQRDREAAFETSNNPVITVDLRKMK